MEKQVQPSGGTGTLARDGSPAHRLLYEVLDTLVAMRMDCEAKASGMPGAFNDKQLHTMLGDAIASTKNVIENLDRTRR